MRLIEVFLYLFDSFSFKISNQVGVGTFGSVTWYIYLVTPKTESEVGRLINNDFVACPRYRDLLIKSNYPLDSNTDVSITIEELIALRNEILLKSNLGSQLPIGKDLNLESRFLELHMVI